MKKIHLDFDRSSKRKMYEVPSEDVWSYPDKTYHLPMKARWNSHEGTSVVNGRINTSQPMSLTFLKKYFALKIV